MGTHLSPPQKGSGAATPIFGPCPLWPNGWMDPDGTWHGGGLGPDHIVLDEYPALLPPPKKGVAEPLNFRPMSIVATGQTSGWIEMPLGTMVGLGPGDIVLHGDPAAPKKGLSPLIFGPCPLWPNGCMYHDTTWHRGRPQPR